MLRAYLELQVLCKMQLAKSSAGSIIAMQVNQWSLTSLSTVLICHMLQMQFPRMVALFPGPTLL